MVCAALSGKIRVQLTHWNRVEAEAKHLIKLVRAKNRPGPGYKELSKGALFRI